MIVTDHHRHHSLSTFCFTAFVLSILLHCGALSAGQATSITKDVTATLEGVRTWTHPQTRFALLENVPKESVYYWTFEGGSIGGGPRVLIQSEGQGDEDTILGKPERRFVRRGVKVPTAKGKFLEVLVVLRNGSKTETFIRNIGKDNKVGIILEIPGGQPIYPVDFVLPGLSSSQMAHLKALQAKGLTVVSEFMGTLGVSIGKEGLTWVILQYDVPKGSMRGNLKILDATPIPINWK